LLFVLTTAAEVAGQLAAARAEPEAALLLLVAIPPTGFEPVLPA
jgi:hypothetical protein